MPHHVYTTDAFVLESFPSREADKTYVFFTKDLGKIRASAQGVRNVVSKLRYSLQDFSRVTIAVVRGKEFWRITSAALKNNLYSDHKEDKAFVYMTANVFLLLKRLVPEEEKNEALFGLLAAAFDFASDKKLTPDEIKAFENILVLKVLNNLGYLGAIAHLDVFIRQDISTELLTKMQPLQRVAVTEINKSMKETQL